MGKSHETTFKDLCGGTWGDEKAETVVSSIGEKLVNFGLNLPPEHIEEAAKEIERAGIKIHEQFLAMQVEQIESD
jgi:hypothetical protein